MWRIFRRSELAVVNHENGVFDGGPIASKARGKALCEKEDMIPTIGRIPVRVVIHDVLHGVVEVAACTDEVVRLFADKVARGVNRDIKEISLVRICGAHGAVEEMTMYMNLAGVEIGVAIGVADLRRRQFTRFDQVGVETRRKVIHINGKSAVCIIGVLPSLQRGNEVLGSGGIVRRSLSRRAPDPARGAVDAEQTGVFGKSA